jgi:hypothetical protein
MISDVLADAEADIQRYLSDPAYADMYAALRLDIQSLLWAMRHIREKLDALPTAIKETE